MNETIDTAGAELAEELALGPKEWADIAAEYARLSAEKSRLDARVKSLSDGLKRAASPANDPAHGIYVEGKGTLIIVPARYGYAWDLNALHEQRPADFYRILDLHAMDVDNAKLEPFIKAGDFTGEALKPPYRGELRSPRLKWEQRGVRR